MSRLTPPASAEQSKRISPTAHYTAYVWYRNGLSHSALATDLGRALYLALRPGNAIHARLSGRPDLEMMLLARHVIIDALLDQEIQSGRTTQIIEIAAGLSPRGLSFAGRYPSVRYLEADLPDMANHKRRRLDAAGLRKTNHEVVPIDALSDGGPLSLAALTDGLDADSGTAVITEGLLGYFPREAVEGLWARIAGALGRFRTGVYLSELNVASDLRGMAVVGAFRALLSTFARGQVHVHWDTPEAVVESLLKAGFDSATTHRPEDYAHLGAPGMERKAVVRIIEARRQRS